MIEKKPITGVKGIVFDQEKKKVLLLRRAKNLLLGRCDLPGGEKELSDLTPEAALRREITEELGIPQDVVESLQVQEYEVTFPNLARLFPDIPMFALMELTLHTFGVEGIDASTPIALQEEEVSHADWYDIKQVRLLVATGEMLPVIADQVLRYMVEMDKQEKE